MFTEPGEIGLSAGNDFVGIALMTYIPEQLVGLKIEDIVHCQGQLYYAEVAGQMSAGLAHRADNKAAYLISQSLELGHRQLLQILRTVYLFQQFTHKKALFRCAGVKKHTYFNRKRRYLESKIGILKKI